MKIGILTLSFNINYGGVLQAYALQYVLKNMGHEVYFIEIVDKPMKLPIYKMPYSYSKRIIKNILGHKCPILYEQKYNKEKSIIQQNIDRFIKKYLNVIKYNSFYSISEHEYDIIIVGSDQVWRPKYFYSDEIENAYLKFAENWKIRRIAYAVSFGTENWEYTPSQTMKCKRLLEKFCAISVRESSAIKLCEEKFNKQAQLVLDPTMLLSKEDYIKLFKEYNIPKSKGNLLCYILDETTDKIELIKLVVHDKNLIPFYVKSRTKDINLPLQERIQPSVEEWIRGFYDADFIVTDSFHACIFSILFQKPFIVYGNKYRGLTRFNSLLEVFGLRKNLILNLSEYNIKNDYSIDKECIEKISSLKKISLTFLEKNLYGKN